MTAPTDAFSRDDLLRALADCYDPALSRSIISLGLVSRAELTLDVTAPGATVPGAEPRFIAQVELSSSSADEAATAMLTAQVSNRLAGIRQISRSEVRVQPSPFAILRTPA